MKKSLHLLLVFAALFGGIPGYSQQETTQMTLEEAINYAWNNTTVIKNAGINIADAEQQIVEQRATGLPSISASANLQRYLEIPVQVLPDQFVQLIEALNPGEEVSPEAAFLLRNNFTAGVNLETMIFDATFFTGLRAARAYRRYVQEEMAVERRKVRNQVTDAYLPLLLIDRSLELLDKNIANLEKLLFETQESYEAGFAEQLDVDRLRLSLANLQNDRTNLEEDRKAALNTLKFVLNYPMDQPLDITENLVDLERMVAGDALTGPVNPQKRPEVSLSEAGIELQELNVEVRKKAFLPTLRATAAYQQIYQGDNFSDGFWAPNSVVGINLNVPIFSGLGNKAAVERAQLEKEKVLNQQTDLLRSIRMEVENARIQYLNARRSLDSQKENLDLAERIYNTTQIKYREGVGSSLEVNQAEQSLYDTQRSYIQALFDLVTARFDLLEALGYQ